ncbi:Membrane fusion protein (MFP) family protein [Gammaproteobacteria bacterium]
MINKFLAERTNKKERVDVDFLPDADAIEQRPLGGVTRWTIYSLVGMIVALVSWASISEIDEIVTGHGRLVTRQPNLIVQPIETAIIQSIDVRVGQIVRKGQRLASLDPTFVAADESQLRGRLSSLDAKTKRLEQELAKSGEGKNPPHQTEDEKLQSDIRVARIASYRSRMTQFDETLEKLKASLLTNQSDQQSLTARVKLLKEMEVMQERLLAQNIGARQRYLEAQEKRLEVDRDLGMVRHREEEIRREILAAQAERESFSRDWHQRTMEDLAQIRSERDTVSDQLQKAEKRRALVTLETPVDAIVLEVAKLSVGSVAREAEPLVTLVPLDVPLDAEVQIDATEIGFVKIGDVVRIKFDAFPFQKHGTLPGSVEMITEDAFSRDSAQRRAAGQTSDVYYLADIALGTTRLENVGKDFRLFPGLTLSAEIKVGKRKVISYFLYPILRTLDEGIRER